MAAPLAVAVRLAVAAPPVAVARRGAMAAAATAPSAPREVSIRRCCWACLPRCIWLTGELVPKACDSGKIIAVDAHSVTETDSLRCAPDVTYFT